MKRKTILLSILVSLIAVHVYAGWTNRGRKTIWTDRPTPASVWMRNFAGDLEPAAKIQIFDNTIKHYNYAAAGVTETNTTYDLGFWDVDVNGDYSVHADVGADDCTTNITPLALGEWFDVQWDCDANGDLMPKK